MRLLPLVICLTCVCSQGPGKGKATSLQYLPPENFTKTFIFNAPVMTLAANDPCPGAPGTATLGCYSGHIRLCRGGQTEGQAERIHDCRANGCSVCPQGPDVCNNANGQNVCSQVPQSIWIAACQNTPQPWAFCSSHVRWCNGGTSYIVEYCGSRGCSGLPLQCLPGNSAPTTVSPPPTFAPVPTPPFPPVPTPPPATPTPFPGCQRIRREWSTLTFTEKAAFVNALLQLYNLGFMQQMADKHRRNSEPVNYIHGSGPGPLYHFMIWHRAFVFELEERIRALPGYQCFALPYWNWDFSQTPQLRSDPRSVFGEDAGHLGRAPQQNQCIGGAFANVRHTLNGNPDCIRRAIDFSQVNSMTCSLLVDFARIGQPGYDAFGQTLQFGCHGIPHLSFGNAALGLPFATHNSPIDPLFFLHHANVDRLWDMWQDCHRNYNWPPGANQQIVGFPGSVASHFIDNSQTYWAPTRATHVVSYTTDLFEDPAVYSSNFRQAVRTGCQNGTFLRYRTPRALLTVDDQWASARNPSGVPLSFAVSVTVQDVPLQCERRAGAATYGAFHAEMPLVIPVAAYDNFSLQECVAVCSELWWKPAGVRNCLCTALARGVSGPVASFAAGKGKTKPPPTTVNRFTSQCPQGDQSTYAFYRAPQPIPTIAPGANNELCFDTLAAPRTPAPLACSSDATTPPPLPRKWLRMNNISFDNANICAKFKNETGTLSLTCVNK